MSYFVDFLMKTVDQVLTQNKHNPLYQLDFYQEAHHRIAAAIEFIGAPMQLVLPSCETALKVYDIVEFGTYYRYPQNSQKPQKLQNQFREFTNRDHANESEWTPALKEYVARKAVVQWVLTTEL